MPEVTAYVCDKTTDNDAGSPCNRVMTDSADAITVSVQVSRNGSTQTPVVRKFHSSAHARYWLRRLTLGKPKKESPVGTREPL